MTKKKNKSILDSPRGQDGVFVRLYFGADFKPQPIKGLKKWLEYLRDPKNRRVIAALHVKDRGECCLGAKRTTEGYVWPEPDEGCGVCKDVVIRTGVGRVSVLESYSKYLGQSGLSSTGAFPVFVTAEVIRHEDPDTAVRFLSLASLNDHLPGDDFTLIAWVIEQVFCEQEE